MRSREHSAGWIAATALWGCFGDPPAVGSTDGAETADESTMSTTSASATASTAGGSTQETIEPETSSTTEPPDPGTASTTGTSDWCAAPDLLALPRYAPGAPVTFDAVARIGPGLWVAGTDAPLDLANPVAWPIEGEGIGTPVGVPTLGQDYALVSFLGDVNGPPRVIYNESTVRVLVYDDPADGVLVSTGQWNGPSTSDTFGDVARTSDGKLWAAAVVNGGNEVPRWAIVSSVNDGTTWESEPFDYSMDPAQPAQAHAIDVGDDGSIAIAGVALDSFGTRHWVAFSYPYSTGPDGEPDVVSNGAALTVLLVGDDVLVGGEIGGQGALRHAAGDAVFGSAGSFDHPVRDLALGAEGTVLALWGPPDGGFSVSACSDPMFEPDCWRKLAEEPLSGLNAASMFVDGDAIWIAASWRDEASDRTEGALYRLDCSG